MRILQLATYYPAYLTALYARQPDLASASYDKQIDALIADGFGAGHIVTPYLPALGHEAMLVVGNCAQAQTQWALSHGLPAPRTPADFTALAARQIDDYKPDVLYVLDPVAYEGRFISTLRHRPGFILQWRAANIPSGIDWSVFDLMISSDEGCRRRAAELGVKATAHHSAGFAKRIAAAVAGVPRSSDLVFVGQLSREHTGRTESLLALLQGLSKSRLVSTTFHFGAGKDAPVPDELRRRDKGAVFGMEMYRAIRGGRVAPNFHIDLAATRSNNMRMFETTGVGTFILTDEDPSVKDFFAPGQELETFASREELIEKTLYYLDHEAEREDIARRGQARCLRDHSMEARAAQLMDTITRAMTAAKSKRPAAPKHALGDTDTGWALLRRGNVAESASALNRALQSNGRDGLAIVGMARVAFLAGEPARALELLGAAGGVATSAELAWLIYCDMAVVRAKLNQWDAAAESYRAALTFGVARTQVEGRLKAILRRQGRSDEANLLGDSKDDSDPATFIDIEIHDGQPCPTQEPTTHGASMTPPSPRAANDDNQLQAAFPGVTFGHGVQCIGMSSVSIGPGSVIGDDTWINVCIRDGKKRLVVGEAVLIGRRATLSSGTHLEVGAHTIFGPNVYLSSAEHEYEGNHLKPILHCGVDNLGSVVVEENCWVGTNAVVTGNIVVGRGSVIGANSVVRQSLPPFVVAVGSPARIVKMFNPATGAWEPLKTAADQQRIEQARAAHPLPNRAQFLATLRAAAGGQGVPPIVAGRAEHLP
ncbi:MAG: glycosyltransferase [Rhodospirillaceae bacterium]|nr:glycosyltransferase [Rhodospirillaceae bacterium]